MEDAKKILRICECGNEKACVVVEIVEDPEGSGKLKATITFTAGMAPAIPPGGEIPIANAQKPKKEVLEGQNLNALTSKAKDLIVSKIGNVNGWQCRPSD